MDAGVIGIGGQSGPKLLESLLLPVHDIISQAKHEMSLGRFWIDRHYAIKNARHPGIIFLSPIGLPQYVKRGNIVWIKAAGTLQVSNCGTVLVKRKQVNAGQVQRLKSRIGFREGLEQRSSVLVAVGTKISDTEISARDGIPWLELQRMLVK